MRLEGCMTALVTPFTGSEVDYEGLRSNIRFQIENGISGIVPLGTTGESPTIEEGERQRIVKVSVEEASGKAKVIVGTGTNSTKSTIEHTLMAQDAGADAVLIVAPYYNKPSQEGLYRHFEAVSKVAHIPIILYNIAGRTGVNIEVKTLLRLSDVSNIVGVKEASGNMAQIMEILSRMPETFSVLSGDDSLTLPMISAGARGVISVASNLLPKKVASLVEQAGLGNNDHAREINSNLSPIFKALFIETNPVPVKTAMNLCGMPAGPVRLPLVKLSEENLQFLKSVIRNYHELRISDRRAIRLG